MKSSTAAELATRISRVIISESRSRTRSAGSWTPSLEQALHLLRCRESLTPLLVARVIDPFLLTHHSLALGFFNWASQQPGFSHTSETYQSILKSLSLSRQFNAIELLLKQVKSQKIALNSRVYHSLIDSLIIGKKTQSAFLLFSEVISMNQEMGPKSCNLLLAALSSDGYFEYAKKVFDEMTLRTAPLSTFGFGVFIWRSCRDADVMKVLSMLDEVKRCNSEINGSVLALLIIHGLCGATRASEAFWVLEELRNRDCKPDFMAYWIVGEAFLSTGDVVDREKVLKKKRKLGVAPRISDYMKFIFTLVSSKMIREAKELGEVIVKGNFPIEDDVLNMLIGTVSSIDPSSALMFFNFMVEKERFPTHLTLSNLSRNLCKHGKINELLDVFHVLGLHDYFKDSESYNIRISFLCKAGRAKEAYEVLQEMKKKGMTPDVSFYNSVMETCCREDLIRPAKRLWDEMFTIGCDGNLRTYNILIGKLLEVGEVEEAQRLYQHMIGKGVKPDVTTYISLLNGLCKEKRLEDAFQVFGKSVEQDNVILARTVLNSFILSLCKEGLFLAASELLRSLKMNVGDSDADVTFLQALVDAGEIKIAAEHVEWVREMSPTTLPVIFSQLLALLSSSSKPEPIRQILRTVEKL